MSEEREIIRGTVSHIVYRREDNGYTVLELSRKEGEITCVGNFLRISEGDSVELTGQYTEHYTYGRQFRVEHCGHTVPRTAEAIELYLGSGAVKGIGRTLAARIVDAFGDDTLRILEEEPERLAEVRGISLRSARLIGAQAAEQAETRHAMMFLEQYEIPMQLAVRIYRHYGDAVYEILRENPYKLAEDIDGIGFVRADRIARAAGISDESEYRIRSGILYCLQNAAGEGSVYLPEETLTERAAALLSVPGELVDNELTTLAVERRIVTGKNGEIYLAGYYHSELACARMLLDLNVPTGMTEEQAERLIAKQEAESRIELEEEQRRAVLTAAMRGLLILTGGPGTGKTTTINEIIRIFRARRLRFVLAAPTGRAAKRMTETTGYEASTIHRLLEIGAADGELMQFGRDGDNPIEADAVIIDEMSMVDISLFHALLAAIGPGTRLILVGDEDQLPSVGPGAVLRDLLRSGAFPSVRLERIFRQSGSSDIVVNAHRINRGEEIRMDNQSRDFFFLSRDDPGRIVRNTIELIRDRLPGYVNAPWQEIQVLSPTRKGALGVERLNALLQRWLNPPSPDAAEKQYGDRLFRVGDKVMQTRNNYDMPWEVTGRNGIVVAAGSGIFNGDMGVIREIDEHFRTMRIEFDDGRFTDYPFEALDDLDHAYAITIHKSQGSEYPAVILPLLGGPRLLMTRNLLYTAVTRAKSCVVILGSAETVREMIANKTEQLRYTSLGDRICELEKIRREG